MIDVVGAEGRQFEYGRRLVLGGGGDANDERPLHEKFVAWLPAHGRVLCVPVAMPDMAVDAAITWCRSVLKPLGIDAVDGIRDLSTAPRPLLGAYDGVFISGGNAFRLMRLMRASGFDQALIEFVLHGGPVFAGSAGAIVLGKQLGTAVVSGDSNAEEQCAPLDGLDLGGGYSVACHYAAALRATVVAYGASHALPVIALPERGGIVIDGEGITAAGYEGAVVVVGGSTHELPAGSRVRWRSGK
jgi:dipeptidase E